MHGSLKRSGGGPAARVESWVSQKKRVGRRLGHWRGELKKTGLQLTWPSNTSRQTRLFEGEGAEEEGAALFSARRAPGKLHACAQAASPSSEGKQPTSEEEVRASLTQLDAPILVGVQQLHASLDLGRSQLGRVARAAGQTGTHAAW